MKWSLRSARSDELADVLTLVRAYHAFEDFDLPEEQAAAALARLLREPALGGIWLVLADGVVAGYIVLCIGFSIEFGGHDAFIDEFYLAPEFRGRGGGRAALALISEEARNRDVLMLHLEVARDNHTARKLYADSGFEAREKYVLMSQSLTTP